MSRSIRSLKTPDQAGFSTATLKALRALAGFSESQRSFCEITGSDPNRYDPDLVRLLAANLVVHKSRFGDEVFQELLNADYITESDVELLKEKDFYVNNYSHVHPNAIMAGSDGATHEVLISQSYPGDGTVIGFVRTTRVDMHSDLRNIPGSQRMRLLADGVDEEHGRAFLAELSFIGNISGMFGDNTVQIGAVLTSISGYPLGTVPSRTEHECFLDASDCDVKYDMDYSPSYESHDALWIPKNHEKLVHLDVFRGAAVNITIRPVGDGESA